MLTCFVIIMLGAAATIFAYDASLLVLRPIEMMLKIVDAISHNPLETAYKDVATMQTRQAVDLREGFETTVYIIFLCVYNIYIYIYICNILFYYFIF